MGFLKTCVDMHACVYPVTSVFISIAMPLAWKD